MAPFGGGCGGFWRGLFSRPATSEDEGSNEEWDHHGLPPGTTFQLRNLNRLKKYKLSEFVFTDLYRRDEPQPDGSAGDNDVFPEIYSILQSGVIYTRAQLKKELETLSTCGIFDYLAIQGKANPDGTIGLTTYFTERTWLPASTFRCINVYGRSYREPNQEDLAKMIAHMSKKAKIEYMQQQEIKYQRKIDGCSPCMLPPQFGDEISMMLSADRIVSARLLNDIRDRVQKWYHDKGYACAQVVNFGNLNTSEIVCEVMEGVITEVVFWFHDKLGNLVQGNRLSQYDIASRELLPKELALGQVFNLEVAKRYMNDANLLELFSHIEIKPLADEKDGGIILDISFTELD